MSWWTRATTPRDTLALERIANALDRIAPLPTEPLEAEPSAVDYVDEEKIAAYDTAERVGQLERYVAELEEQARAEEELERQEEGTAPDV